MYKNKGKKGKARKRDKTTKKQTASVKTNELDTLADAVEKCEISTVNNPTDSFSPNEESDQSEYEAENNPDNEQPNASVLSNETKPNITFKDDVEFKQLSKWKRTKSKVPAIYLHRSEDYMKHAKTIVSKGIEFYFPTLKEQKIICPRLEHYKALKQYCEKNDLPFHTYGQPTKKFMKVVIKGLVDDVDLRKLKSYLIKAGVPIKRINKMHVKECIKTNSVVLLAVVPIKENEDKLKLLKVETIYGRKVTMEPPIKKAQQCHRCQKWGHAQRHCYGIVKCVKCAGDHVSSECTRDPQKEPPKCANCKGEHTASYRKCSYCPESIAYKMSQDKKPKNKFSENQLLTAEYAAKFRLI